MRGQFVFQFPNTPPIIIPNRVVDEGEESFLKMIFQGDVADVSLGGNFYIGLCEEVPDDLDTIASITTEPTGVGGYARLPVIRDGSVNGWPTISLVNGDYKVESKVVTFTATGADYSRSFNRAFLCNIVSGTAGVLFAYSGPLASPVLLLDGADFAVKYEFFLR